ncbi:MAG: hypothetical protein LBL90_01620 [Prevotellaceae bacterium]|jgi:hypothetical protein|nr:hypothetical protein [Prevotellaceae bacterium]
MLVWRQKKYKKVYTVEDFIEIRRAKGLSECSNDKENEGVHNFCADAFATWKPVDNDFEYVIPTSSKQLKASMTSINKAIELAPTNSEIVDNINYVTNIINADTKRYFDGSVKLIVVTAIVGLLAWWRIGFNMAVIFFVGIILYVVQV